MNLDSKCKYSFINVLCIKSVNAENRCTLITIFDIYWKSVIARLLSGNYCGPCWAPSSFTLPKISGQQILIRFFIKENCWDTTCYNFCLASLQPEHTVVIIKWLLVNDHCFSKTAYLSFFLASRENHGTWFKSLTDAGKQLLFVIFQKLCRCLSIHQVSIKMPRSDVYTIECNRSLSFHFGWRSPRKYLMARKMRRGFWDTTIWRAINSKIPRVATLNQRGATLVRERKRERDQSFRE